MSRKEITARISKPLTYLGLGVCSILYFAGFPRVHNADEGELISRSLRAIATIRMSTRI